ncbi:MAG: alkaline phosphatase [Alphaproteobacteria bacterium TMED87]|nr:alkaline phosphatase [Rhodospirillaceae bacterium]OUV08399.1 MAG: alkaline phosphatase [Alphaproteobacteria bacterium TMED87]|tara:strand:+ start:54 stop:368 length:315 start_codon:yes stop_codon:yes gene_type:complete
MDEMTKTKIEAAAFRALVKHLQIRNDVQNIELMNLSGFCRNCLAKWFKLASEEYSSPVNYDEARNIIYGMDHLKWKEKYQTQATSEQKKKFEKTKDLHAKITLY